MTRQSFLGKRARTRLSLVAAAVDELTGKQTLSPLPQRGSCGRVLRKTIGSRSPTGADPAAGTLVS